jgi:hypothetical protein
MSLLHPTKAFQIQPSKKKKKLIGLSFLHPACNATTNSFKHSISQKAILGSSTVDIKEPYIS